MLPPYTMLRELKSMAGISIDKISLDTNLARASLYRHYNDPTTTANEVTKNIIWNFYKKHINKEPLHPDFQSLFESLIKTRNEYYNNVLSSSTFKFLLNTLCELLELKSKRDNSSYVNGSLHYVLAQAKYDLFQLPHGVNEIPQKPEFTDVDSKFKASIEYLKLTNATTHDYDSLNLSALILKAEQSRGVLAFMNLPEKDRGNSEAARSLFKDLKSLEMYQKLLEAYPHDERVPRNGLNVASIMQHRDDSIFHLKELYKILGPDMLTRSINGLSPISIDKDLNWLHKQDFYKNY